MPIVASCSVPAVPSDVYLGGVSGLGGGVAKMTQLAGLGGLMFIPISNKNSTPDNPNAAQIMGPEGAVIRTQDGNTSLTVNGDGITMKFGDKTVTLDGSGLTIDGVLFDTHTHTYSPGTNPPIETGGPQS